MTTDNKTGSPDQQRRDPGSAHAKDVTGADCGEDRIGPDQTVLTLVRIGTKRCRLLAAFMAVAFGLVSQSATVAYADSARTVLYLDAPSVSDSSAARAGEVAEAYAADGSPTATDTLAWLALPEGRGGEVNTETLSEGTREAFASVTAPEPSSSGDVTEEAVLAAGETMLAQLEDVDVKEPGAAEELAEAGAVRPVLGDGTVAEAIPEAGAEEDAPATQREPEYLEKDATPAAQPPEKDVPDFEPPELASVPEKAPAAVGVSGEPNGAPLAVESGDPETEDPEVGEGVELASAPSESVPTAEPQEPADEGYSASGPLTDTGPMDESTSEGEEPPPAGMIAEPSEPSQPTGEVALAPTPMGEATTEPMESAPVDDGTDDTGYGSSPPATEPTAEPAPSQPMETAETAPTFPAGEATGPTGYEGEEDEIALARVPGDDGEVPESAPPAPESASMDDGQFSESTQSTQENQFTQETQDVQSPATPVAEETTPVSPVAIEQSPDGTNEDGGTEGSGETTLRDGEASQPNSPDGAPIPTEEASGPEAEYEIVVGESEDDMPPTPPESSEPEAGLSPASSPEGAPDRTPEDQPTASLENGSPDGGGGEANAPATPGGEASTVEVEEPPTEVAPSAPAAPSGDTADPDIQGAGGASEPTAPTPPAEEARAPGVGRPGPEVREDRRKDRQAQRREQYRAEREARRDQQAQGALQTGPYGHATVEQQGGQVEIVEDQQVIVEGVEADIARAERHTERHAERRAARQEAVAVEKQAAMEQQQALEAAALEQARQQRAYERQVAADAEEQQLAYEQQVAQQQVAERQVAEQAAVEGDIAQQQTAQQGVVAPQGAYAPQAGQPQADPQIAQSGYTQPATASVPQSVPQTVEQTYTQPAQQDVPEPVQPADYTATATQPQAVPQAVSKAQPEPRVAQAAQPDHAAMTGTTPQITPTATAAPTGDVASGAAPAQPAEVSSQQVVESVSNVTQEVTR